MSSQLKTVSTCCQMALYRQQFSAQDHWFTIAFKHQADGFLPQQSELVCCYFRCNVTRMLPNLKKVAQNLFWPKFWILWAIFDSILAISWVLQRNPNRYILPHLGHTAFTHNRIDTWTMKQLDHLQSSCTPWITQDFRLGAFNTSLDVSQRWCTQPSMQRLKCHFYCPKINQFEF